MNITIKCIINIFTIKDGNLYLLVKNNGSLLEVESLDDLDTTCTKYLDKNILIKDLNLKQCYTFSEKKKNLNIDVLYVDIVNYNSIKINDKFKFIEFDSLEKNKYIEKSIEYIKEKIILNSTIKRLYPDEFVLPEIQKIYEKLLNKKYDRRNFRKKLIKLDVIESLDKTSKGKNGRPSKLYKFKDMREDKILF